MKGSRSAPVVNFTRSLDWHGAVLLDGRKFALVGVRCVLPKELLWFTSGTQSTQRRAVIAPVPSA